MAAVVLSAAVVAVLILGWPPHGRSSWVNARGNYVIKVIICSCTSSSPTDATTEKDYTIEDDDTTENDDTSKNASTESDDTTENDTTIRLIHHMLKDVMTSSKGIVT